MQKKNILLKINRLPQHQNQHYEIKDPSVVKINDGSYVMYASIGNSIEQTWLVGRFIANNLLDEWQEIEPVIFHNLAGPQLCAPAVMYENINGQNLWTMYIQTACFEADGIIAFATSNDGQNFYGQPHPLASRETIVNSPSPVIGVYDAGISEIKYQGEDLLCLLYSGYRRIGCGDLYLSTKRKNEEQWSAGKCIISQEDIPFHNRPDDEFFEWGLEGAKLVQLADDCLMMIGVCFLPLPNGALGTRQRVFLAVADNINGPYKPVGTPFAPQKNDGKSGENGHPDTLVNDEELVVIYQERLGNGQPWHLRAAAFNINWMQDFLRIRLKELSANKNTDTLMTSKAAQYYFSHPSAGTITQPTFEHTA